MLAERKTTLCVKRAIQLLTQTELFDFASLACTVNNFRVPTSTYAINKSEAQEPTDQCCQGTLSQVLSLR